MPANRWTSRKFLLSLATQVTALLVILWPQHESAILQASQSITALVVMVLTTLGYVHAEAGLDRNGGVGGGGASSSNPAPSESDD
jgi:hypothetical protein